MEQCPGACARCEIAAARCLYRDVKSPAAYTIAAATETLSAEKEGLRWILGTECCCFK